MDFELKRAKEKLEKEQKERKEKARLKLERERKAKQEAVRLREAVEAVQQARRIEAAEAEAKADQQTQESLLVGRGVTFIRTLEAVPYQGSGDKIKLPPSCFTDLSEEGAFDKGPLHFSLSLVHHNSFLDDGRSDKEPKITHAGVLEFTAEEGFVALPLHCWSNLFPTATPESTTVEVQYVWLPKGTYAKLQSLESGFSDIPNHKAVLETSLRQHATLSRGDILTVNHGILTYHLSVLELKPASSVSVLETDIEVDVMGPDKTQEENQPVLKPLFLGKPYPSTVHEGKYKYYKFFIDHDTWRKVSSKEEVIMVNLDPTTEGGDTDLYVSKHPLLFPTIHQHHWSSHDIGSKALLLSADNPNMGPGNYTVAVYGFKGTSKYLISVTCEKQDSGQRIESSTTSFADVDTLECRNCKRFIPLRTIALHEAYCSRHNKVCKHPSCGVVLRADEVESHVHCEKCGQAFQNVEIGKHMKVFHEPLQCPCGIILEKEQMVQHQTSDCTLRLITCRFCGDMVQAGTRADDARDRIRGLSEHESQCGSRTAPCDSCGRSVMLKDMDIHQVAVHQKS